MKGFDMRNIGIILLICGLLVIAVPFFLCSCKSVKNPQESNSRSPAAVSAGKLYTFTVNDIDGQQATLSQYKGKVLLIVNVASKCGFTNQYTDLQELYTRYKDRGFAVLGFPANNFLSQEPGSNSQIKEFCSTKFHATFPMFAKISVKGEDIDPLYKYLTSREENAPFDGSIKWNFSKFLIGKDGQTIGRFGSSTSPLDKEVVEMIEKALDAEGH
jgi:glutathione peroxidase-family protein